MKIVVDKIKAYRYGLAITVCVAAYGWLCGSQLTGCSLAFPPGKLPAATGTSVDSLDPAAKDTIPAVGRGALGSISEAETLGTAAGVAATAGTPGADRVALAMERYAEAMRAHADAIVASKQIADPNAWQAAKTDSIMQSGWVAIAGFLAGRRTTAKASVATG